MSITGILVLVGIGAVGILVVWLSVRSKRKNKLIDKAKGILAVSKDNDKDRKEAIAKIDAKIAKIEVKYAENEVVIAELRKKVRTEKDENEKAKKKDEVRDLVNKRNRIKTEKRRAEIEKNKLVE
ncbi:MAG: hypothetical protein DRJ01_00560 [Bacteroidetes bacterium]|nr:MAG: hypothetical protein DRJ01_00560 [Bacteroidota bacterium]